MKIVPILAITNALALGLAIFVYVKQGEHPGSPRSEARPETGEVAKLRMRVEELELALKAPRTTAAADVPFESAAPAASKGATARGGESEAPLAAPPPDAEPSAEPGAADSETFDFKEMEVFRKKVRKANELNQEEEQKKGIVDGIDRLVKENKIAPLSPTQKDAVATVVITSRRKGLDVFRKLRESGALESGNREARGQLIRAEMETIRAETQRALEDIMPAADAKAYLDETTRDQMRFGGFGGATPVPAAPVPTR